MLTLFPFEEAIYRKVGVAATYVGHPLADLIPQQDQTASTRAQLKIAPQRKVIALLPGSRQSELRYMADTFIATAKLLAQRIEQPLFLVPLVNILFLSFAPVGATLFYVERIDPGARRSESR